MAGFSIDAALKSGFGLAKREWKAVLAWGVGYLLLGVAMQLIQLGALGGALPEYFQALGEDPASAAATLEQASPAATLMALPLILILGLVGMVIFYGAVCRALLRPEQRGFFFLRLGRGELWMLLTTVALSVLTLLAVVPFSFLFFAVLDAVRGDEPSPLLAVLLAVPVVLGYLYAAARFSVAWVQAWDEERFVLLDAWRLTRGQGWRIVLAIVALIFLILIISVVVLVPMIMVAGIVVGVAGAAGGGGAVAVTVLVGLAALVFLAVFNGVIYTVIAAPYVEIYRALKTPG